MHRKSALQLPMTMMLGKELLSGLWVRPECRSCCCHFHIRSCLTSCFTFYSFFTTRCDTASSLFASKCLGERYAWMNGCSLWSRGSWLGGSLVSALSFVASITLLAWPLCVVLCYLCCASFSVAILIMTHKMSSCMLVLHSWYVDPSYICVFCHLFWKWLCVCHVCFDLTLVAFVFGLCFSWLGHAHWTVYRSHSLSHFHWLSTQ